MEVDVGSKRSKSVSTEHRTFESEGENPGSSTFRCVEGSVQFSSAGFGMDPLFVATGIDGETRQFTRAENGDLVMKSTKILMGLLFLHAPFYVENTHWYRWSPWNDDSSDETFRNRIGQEIAPGMVKIPGGEFQMGCGPEDSQCAGDEQPAHRVQIRAFRLGKYEVTQAQWRAVMGENPAHFQGDDHPVERVSWNDVQEFLKRLNAQNRGKPYRLPTEAEWEYAARAGTTTPYWWGKEVGQGNANCDGCGSRWDNKETAPVGSFKPNPFGLYDTAGNVWEWVQDCWHDNYQSAPADGWEWHANCLKDRRVLRGGSWHSDPRNLRVSLRDWRVPSNRHGSPNGLRLAQDL